MSGTARRTAFAWSTSDAGRPLGHASRADGAPSASCRATLAHAHGRPADVSARSLRSRDAGVVRWRRRVVRAQGERRRTDQSSNWAPARDASPWRWRARALPSMRSMHTPACWMCCAASSPSCRQTSSGASRSSKANMQTFELPERFGLVIAPFRAILHNLTEDDLARLLPSRPRTSRRRRAVRVQRVPSLPGGDGAPRWTAGRRLALGRDLRSAGRRMGGAIRGQPLRYRPPPDSLAASLRGIRSPTACCSARRCIGSS